MQNNPYESPPTNQQRRHDARCYFCEQSYRDVGPLVEAPIELYICNACARRAVESISDDKCLVELDESCSFCRKKSSKVGPLFSAPGGERICADCAKIVQQVVDQEMQRREKQSQR